MDKPTYYTCPKSEELMRRIVEVSNIIAEKSRKSEVTDPRMKKSIMRHPIFGMPYDEVMRWSKEDVSLFTNMCLQGGMNGFIVTGSNGVLINERCIQYIMEHGRCDYKDSYYYHLIANIAKHIAL